VTDGRTDYGDGDGLDALKAVAAFARKKSLQTAKLSTWHYSSQIITTATLRTMIANAEITKSQTSSLL